MPNANTLAFCYKLPGSAVGASSTSEIQFTDSAGNAAVCTVPPGQLAAGRAFRLKLWGRATGGTTTNLTVKLYQGAAINNLIFTSGAIAINSVSGNFQLIADLESDTTSKILQGLARGQVNATAVAQAATSAVTSFDASLVQQFSGSATFSASNAGNLAILEGLEVEAL